MSFLNKIVGRNPNDDGSTVDALAFDTHSPQAAPALPAGHLLETAGEGLGGVSPPQQTVDLDIFAAAPAPPVSLADWADSSEAPIQAAESAEAPGTSVTGNRLRLFGGFHVAEPQRVLFVVVGLGLLVLILVAVLSLLAANRGAVQVGASGQALMQSQRLAKSASQAVIGSPQAFAEVRESAELLVRNVRGLRTGQDGISAAPSGVQKALETIAPLVDRAEKNAATVLGQEKVLTQVGQAVLAISRESSDLLEIAQVVSSLKLRQDASPTELAAVSQLVMLTQRMGKSANELLTIDGVSRDSVFLLGKDLNAFREIAQGLADGDEEQRLPGTKDAQTKEWLARLLKRYEQTRTQAVAILANLQGLGSAREAQSKIIADSETLRKGLETVQTRLGKEAGFSLLNLLVLLLAAAVPLLGGVGLLRLYVRDKADRAASAEAQRQAALREQQETKRVNDANQAAILRLMDELQAVATGDLTHQATVTDDITGAIADSVNYTVEELRTLVSQVQGTVGRVTNTTQHVEATSAELLAASSEQLREIRSTGESVLQMAARIDAVSGQAQETASVASQSLQAAESGRRAVLETIGSMNAIRDQIGETSKRIKRLAQSSEQIGDITELISDITEQTYVLAMNAALQASSAGAAGRGFSIVAEQVQRLAERSGDATRQIAALVRTIQTDTHDAAGAMERSTRSVAEGAQLSDAAGTALAEIDRVSRRLADLIRQISNQALSEAQSANVVAANIQHIFAVTEQAGEGTRSTARMVRELSLTAIELNQSVARFNIG